MRVFNVCFTVVFMGMLTLPLVFVDLSSDRVSVGENRMLAAPPDLTDIISHPGVFIKDFDAWFKDSTGFRERLIKLYNVIDKNKWLNSDIRYTDGKYVFLVGERGHHYFAHVDGFLIPKFQGKQFLSDEQLANMAVKLQEVKAYLDKKGIPLVVMLCTDKESVYPEFYPKSIKRGLEPIQLDKITKYLQGNTSVDVFNIRQALLAEKNNYPLYYVVDDRSFASDFGHYTQLGAFFAYRELMKHINIYFPWIVPYELSDLNIDYDGKGIPRVSFKTGITYKRLDSSFFDDVEVDRSIWGNDAYENTNQSLPVILFLRDSYAAEEYIGKYFAQHFGKAIFIHFCNKNNLDEYIVRYKPDIVVFESAEFQLPWFANCVVGFPELSKVFAYGIQLK